MFTTLGVLAALDPPCSRCALVGHDWGAHLSWQLALLHPHVFTWVRFCLVKIVFPWVANVLYLDGAYS